MTRLLRCAALAVALACSAAPGHGQTSGTPVEAPRALLPADKQALVKEHVEKAKVPVADVGTAVAVGTTVPAGADLFALPEDTMTEVPKVTSYKFLHVANGIAVVDPENRKVVQIIAK